MKTIYLEIEKKQVRSSEPIIRNLMWYNVKTGELQKFVGSELKFRYDIEQKQMVPYVESEEKLTQKVSYKTETNEKKLNDWLNTEGFYYEASINRESTSSYIIAIDFPDENEDGIIASLDRRNFRYTIENQKSDRKQKDTSQQQYPKNYQ